MLRDARAPNGATTLAGRTEAILTTWSRPHGRDHAHHPATLST
jgi:hypothetical protein